MKDVTAVIISFLRPEYVYECVGSLKRQYPGINILVAENGEYDGEMRKFVMRNGGRYIVMPFDSGVCYARNRLMELVQTTYVLVGDDDFYYTDEAKVDKMRWLLASHEDAALIGGRIREAGIVKDYQGTIDREPDGIVYRPIDLEKGLFIHDYETNLRYCDADITFNYFLARTDLIRGIAWDEKIKVAYEHSDWFISLKEAGRKVFFTPDAIVVHKPEHVEVKEIGRYKTFRYRRNDRLHFFRKHKIKWSIGFGGIKTTFDENAEARSATPLVKQGSGEVKAYTMDRSFTWDGIQRNRGDIVLTDRPDPEMVEVGTGKKDSVDNLQKARK